jgi:hypothetical protein
MDTSTAPNALSARQERFCRAYLRAASGTDAARLAGYRPAGAKTQAWRLLKDPRIRARIRTLRAAGGLPAPRHALELLAKLERLYESALECGNQRAGVAAVEAQARLIDRFRLDTSAADELYAEVPDRIPGPAPRAAAPAAAASGADGAAGAAGAADAADADLVDDADPAADADAASDIRDAELFDADLDDPDAAPPPDLAAYARIMPDLGDGASDLRRLLAATRRELADALHASRPQAAPQAPPAGLGARPHADPAADRTADRTAHRIADAHADPAADRADPPWRRPPGAA